MKTFQIIIVSLLLFNSIRTNAQFGIYILKNEKDSTNYYLLKKLTATPDQKYYANCQYVGNNKNAKAGKLLTLDSQIRISSETLFGSNSIINTHIPVILPDNTIRLYSTSKNKGNFNPLITNIDERLSKVDEKNIFTSQSVYIGDIATVDKDNIIIAQAVKDESNTYNITLFQFNLTSNDQIWSSRLISELNELPANIVLMKDRSIVVLAKRYDHSFSSFSPIIYRLSTIGEKIWVKDMTSSIYGFYNQDIIHSHDNELIYISSYQGRNNEIPQTYIFKINSDNGATITKQKIDSLKANGICQLSNDNCLIYGSQSDAVNSPQRAIAAYTIVDQQLSQIYTYKISSNNFLNEEMKDKAKGSNLEGSEIFTGINLENQDILMGGYISLPKESLNNNNFNNFDYLNMIIETNSEGFFIN